jgi:hypothetical protein
MKVELKPFTGINFRGEVVEQPQKFVYVDGRCVGYLPDEPGSRILPTVELDFMLWQAIAGECAAIRKSRVAPPQPIHGPPEEEQELIEG